MMKYREMYYDRHMELNSNWMLLRSKVLQLFIYVYWEYCYISPVYFLKYAHDEFRRISAS